MKKQETRNKKQVASTSFRHVSCILCLVSCFLLLPQWAGAQAPALLPASPIAGLLPEAQCLQQMQSRAGQQERIARQILFGRPAAADEATGNTRYDEDGNAWIKTAAGKWRTDAKGYEDTTWSDFLIDSQTEWEGMNEIEKPSPREPRMAIVAETGATTSQLIPEMLQLYRALQCRLNMVCQGVRASYQEQEPDPDGTITVTTPGCMPLKLKPLKLCTIPAAPSAAGENPTTAQSRTNAFADAIVRGECSPLVQSVLAREAAVLKFTASYDEAYRSLLQFAGNFDRFLGEFHGDLLTPIQEAMPILNQISRIPCFLSQCNL